MEVEENSRTANTGDAGDAVVVIQRNPGSGSGRGRGELVALLRGLRDRGFRVRMFKSRTRLDAWIRQPGMQQRVHCIVAAGGDGTLADVLNRNPNATLFPFPMGTENLMARFIGVRQSGDAAAEAIAGNRIMSFDTGLVNGRRFLLMVSIGVDADVVHRLHSERTGHIVHWTYLRYVISSMWKFRAVRVSAEATGQVRKMGAPLLTASGGHLIVSNLPTYGFGIRFSPEASPHDGRLDVRVFQGVARLSGWFQSVSLCLRMPWKNWRVSRFQSDHIRVFCAGPLPASVAPRAADATLPVQCDGDPCGHLIVSPELFSGHAEPGKIRDRAKSSRPQTPGSGASLPLWPAIDILAAPNSLRLIVPEAYFTARTEQPSAQSSANGVPRPAGAVTGE